MKSILKTSQDYFKNSSKLLLLLDLLKISFIIFIAFSLLAQVNPYYNSWDSYLYGITAIDLSKGEWGYSNELVQETGLWEFVSSTYVLSVDNQVIPKGHFGMHGMTTLSYLLGGYYGLFYLTPIFSILLIIAIDRICVNLFGRFVAFFAVILTGTSWIIFDTGTGLWSDNIFAFFFIIGIFFLVKFFRNKNETTILLSSVFFVASAFIRINGTLSFPLEILLVTGFLFLPMILKNHINIKSITTSNIFYISYKKNRKKIFRIIFFMSVPWLFFFLFNFAYNYIYFDDIILGGFKDRPSSELDMNLNGLFNNFSLDFFQWIKTSGGLLLPDNLLLILPTEAEYVFQVGPTSNDTWLGILSILIMFSAIIISFFIKKQRLLIIIICLFIFGNLMFYTVAWMSRIPSIDEHVPLDLRYENSAAQRYQLPVLPLFYMVFGFTLYNIWSIDTKTIPKIHFKTLAKILKFVFLALVISFLATSFYTSNALQGIIEGGKLQGPPSMGKGKSIFFNPQEALEKRFPLKLEGLSESSIIVSSMHFEAVDMGVIPFYPYWGFNFKKIKLVEPESIPQEPIETLKQLLSKKTTPGARSILDDEYEVFVYKNTYFFDTIYFKHLALDHGIILKDYSKSFCKMELVDELKSSESKPDEICY